VVGPVWSVFVVSFGGGGWRGVVGGPDGGGWELEGRVGIRVEVRVADGLLTVEAGPEGLGSAC
jgi:hypothetical protein